MHPNISTGTTPPTFPSGTFSSVRTSLPNARNGRRQDCLAVSAPAAFSTRRLIRASLYGKRRAIGGREFGVRQQGVRGTLIEFAWRKTSTLSRWFAREFDQRPSNSLLPDPE